MTPEGEFVKALAEALGPLYRVSLLDEDGEVEETYGGFEGERARRTVVPMAGSDRSLAIEVDAGAVDAAARLVRGLSAPAGPGGDEAEAPMGTITRIDRALDELMVAAEAQVGRPIEDMSRADKQRVVRYLDERGAFALRKAVETVADALGVSRFTVYNYLDSSRGE
jgi:hypothetical protein